MRTAATGDTLGALPRIGAIKPMWEEEIGITVEFLDLMLEFLQMTRTRRAAVMMTVTAGIALSALFCSSAASIASRPSW